MDTHEVYVDDCIVPYEHYELWDGNGIYPPTRTRCLYNGHLCALLWQDHNFIVLLRLYDKASNAFCIPKDGIVDRFAKPLTEEEKEIEKIYEYITQCHYRPQTAEQCQVLAEYLYNRGTRVPNVKS